MADDCITIRLHHSGEFLKTEYSGGSYVTYRDIDLDLFSYTVLMEWVKDLSYNEIGGIYIKKRKSNQWSLVTDDGGVEDYKEENHSSELDFFIDCTVDRRIVPMKQMQPHVIVRPRSSPLKAKEKNVEKRQFVSLKQISDEKERRMTSRKKLQFSSTNASSVKDGTVAKNFKVVAEESENVIENHDLTSVTQNKYEMERNKRVAENKRKIDELGLKRMSTNLFQKKNKAKERVANDESETDYYCPENEVEQESDEEDIVTSKIMKKVNRVDLAAGPRTRSRANKIADTRDKEAASGSVLEEENDATIVPVGEKLKDRKTKGPGSMAAYLELRDRQKVQAETQISQTQSQSERVQPSSDTHHEPEKRKRGKTRMDHVHTRREKKEIKLNDKFQPISDEDKTLSELSLFLGTTVRDFVSLTCVSWKEVPDKGLLWQYVKEKYIIPEEGFKWVNKAMADQFRTYKSRIKKDHYTAYKSDEERLKYRPRQIPLADFKILLKYWGDEKVQATADRNKKARSHIVETHTTGPRSFAQVCNKLETKRALERMSIDAEELLEPLQPLCDADIYVETRKRDEKREYKLPTEIVQKKIDDVKIILEAGGSIEAANKVVRGEKEHNPSWLVGRFIRKKESKEKSTTSTTPGASNQYMADLTEKIRDELTQEMDDKVERKVREMMKKLADKNPALKFDIDVTDISSENDNSPSP